MKIEINISNELDICVNIQQEFPPVMIGFHEIEDAFEFVKVVAKKFKDGEEPWKQTAELKKEWEDYSFDKFKKRAKGACRNCGNIVEFNKMDRNCSECGQSFRIGK